MQQILFVCNQYNCLFYIANILFFSVLLFNIFTPCLKFLTFTIFLKVSCFTRFCNHYQILMVVCHFLLYSFMLNCLLLLSECFVWPANHWTSNFIGKNIWRRSCLTSWLTDFHLIFFLSAFCFQYLFFTSTSCFLSIWRSASNFSMCYCQWPL